MFCENLNKPYLPPQILDILRQDGFTIFIRGGKEHGKTNLAVLLMEIGHCLELRKHFATNIKTESFYIEQIINKPDLDHWLQKKHGKKTYVLDELGKHLKKMGFASKKNQDILDVIQLIRHYDCGFIGCAPAGKFVDSSFLLAGDILDLEIKKISKTNALCIDYLHNEKFFWNDIPKTNIWYNSKDIATFTMKKELTPENSTLHERILEFSFSLRDDQWSIAKIQKEFKFADTETAKREFIAALRESHNSQPHVEVDTSVHNTQP